MAALQAILIAVGLSGLLLIVVAFLPGAPEPSRSSFPGRPSMFRRLARLFSSSRRILAVAGLAGGVLIWAMSGWVVFLIGVPIATLLLPALFASHGAKERLSRLDALETWTRSLAGLTVAGAGLEQTIAASQSSANEAIRGPVDTLVARINARWPTASALRGFADEIADPTCDLIVMHLLLAERVRGPGLARSLEDLADSISDEVRARRAIETDRAKPQQNSRIITVTTLVLLVAMPFTGAFMAPYATPLGQVILAVWIAVYALILVWLRRISAPPAGTRMLGGVNAA